MCVVSKLAIKISHQHPSWSQIWFHNFYHTIADDESQEEPFRRLMLALLHGIATLTTSIRREHNNCAGEPEPGKSKPDEQKLRKPKSEKPQPISVSFLDVLDPGYGY